MVKLKIDRQCQELSEDVGLAESVNRNVTRGHWKEAREVLL